MRVSKLFVALMISACGIGAVRAAAPSQDVRDRRTAAPNSRYAGSGPIVAPAGAAVEQYKLNAQYRGGVKKSFSDIGNGHGVYMPQAGGSFAVKLEGAVKDPESDDVYEFFVDMDFQSNGAQVREVKNRSHYSRNAGEYRDRVEKVIPFIYLVKFTQPPRDGQELSRVYRFRGHEYTLRYLTTERNVEATLYEGDTLVGKFFLERGERTPFGIEKFRVPTEGSVVLSFVKV